MERLAQFFLDNKKFTYVVTLIFAVYGGLNLLQIHTEEFPNVNVGNAIVTTNYPGASATEVETKITKPIEDEIRSVRGIKMVRSLSKPGFSQIFIEVDIDRYSVQEVMGDLQRAIDRTRDLPGDLDELPAFVEIKTEEWPVIELAIVGSNDNRLRNRVADELKEVIEEHPGIVEVLPLGYAPRQFTIQLDPKKLQAFNIGIDEVVGAIRSRNVTIPGGEIKSARDQRLLRIEGKVHSISDLETLVVRSTFSGRPVLLKDIAQLSDNEPEQDILYRYGQEPATMLAAKKRGGADIRSLSSDVETIIGSFREKYKDDLKFNIYFNSGEQTHQRITILGSNAVVGLVLVFLFLMLFLPGRHGFVAGLSLPLAMLATVGFMNTAGLTLNSMSILALIIALGMLVDNAVVVAENTIFLQKKGLPTREALLKTVQQLSLPITMTTLTTIFAFVPMLVTTGGMGQFIRSLPIIISFALAFSLFEAFFLLPTRLGWLKLKLPSDSSLKSSSESRSEHHDWFTRWIEPPFARLMTLVVKHRIITFGVYTAILLGSMLLLVKGNDLILFPADQAKRYLMRVEMPVGTPVTKTSEALARLAQKVQDKFGAGIEHIKVIAGESAFDPNDPKAKKGARFGLLYIFISDELKDTVPYKKTLADLRAITIPGIEKIGAEVEIMGPPIGDPVNISFRSNDAAALQAVAQSIVDKLRETPGIFDAQVNEIIGDEEVFVSVDYQKAARLGLNLAHIGETVRTAIAGTKVSDITLNNKKVDLVVQFNPEGRESLESLNLIKIRDPQGNLIPLSTVATFKKVVGEPQIQRFDYKRSKTVTANVNLDELTAVEANEIALAAYAAIQADYPEVSLELGGEGEKTQESMQSLFRALMLSLLAIFGLLVLQFNSYLRPLIILSTIPLGIVGVSVAFFFHDRPISFLALIGILGLGGIIVNTGIILISFIDELRKESDRSLLEIVLEAATRRLRAVVVTSVTTVAGLIPTAYGMGGADEFIIPMCMSLAWGLVSGTLLSLIWVPCAYMITEDIARWCGQKMGRSSREQSLKVLQSVKA